MEMLRSRPVVLAQFMGHGTLLLLRGVSSAFDPKDCDPTREPFPVTGI
jgi:hypothetical protein